MKVNLKEFIVHDLGYLPDSWYLGMERIPMI